MESHVLLLLKMESSQWRRSEKDCSHGEGGFQSDGANSQQFAWTIPNVPRGRRRNVQDLEFWRFP